MFILYQLNIIQVWDLKLHSWNDRICQLRCLASKVGTWSSLSLLGRCAGYPILYVAPFARLLDFISPSPKIPPNRVFVPESDTLVDPLAPTPYTESRPTICNFSSLDRAYNAFNYVLQLSNEASWQSGLGFGYKWSKTTLPPYRILEMDPVRGTPMFL